MSKVPARWERVRRAVEIRDSFFSSPSARGGDLRGGGSKTLILGNGDVTDLNDACKKVKETGADGVMLGRAIFGNPFLFAKQKEDLRFPPSPIGFGRAGKIYDLRKRRLQILIEHAKLFEKLLGEHKSFAIMKKHFKAYVEGFDGAKELRMKLMETENAKQVEKIVSGFLKET